MNVRDTLQGRRYAVTVWTERGDQAAEVLEVITSTAPAADDIGFQFALDYDTTELDAMADDLADARESRAEADRDLGKLLTLVTQLRDAADRALVWCDDEGGRMPDTLYERLEEAVNDANRLLEPDEPDTEG